MKKLVLDASVLVDAYQPRSLNHSHARALVKILVDQKIVCVMPMHGLYEIGAAMRRRSSEIDWNGLRTVATEANPLHMEAVSIDQEFVKAHPQDGMPALRAGDLIYFVVALARRLPIVTHDREIKTASLAHSVDCYSAEEALLLLGTS